MVVGGTGRALIGGVTGTRWPLLSEIWMRLALSVVLFATFALTAPLGAQDRPRPADSVPNSARPPAGMCRIWLPNVPASKQAAPTDCPTAVRNRPANARVIFGDPLPPKAATPGPQLPAPKPLVPTDPKKKKTPPPKTPPPPPGWSGR